MNENTTTRTIEGDDTQAPEVAGGQDGPGPEDVGAEWDHIAKGYDEFVTPHYFDLGADVLQRVGLRPGMRVLDVAAGSGAVSLAAARLGAEVTAIDISAMMIERLRARAGDEGLDVKAHVMDGHALDFDDGTFDVTISEFGVMLFPDLPRALGEMARVTKPGGHTVLVAFGPPTEVEFLDFFARGVRAVVPDFTGLPMDPLPLPFQISDPDALRQRLREAGLKEIRVEHTTKEMAYESGRHLWSWLTSSNPVVGKLLGPLNLSDEQTTAIRRALDELVSERAASMGRGTAVLTSPLNVGIGMK